MLRVERDIRIHRRICRGLNARPTTRWFDTNRGGEATAKLAEATITMSQGTPPHLRPSLLPPFTFNRPVCPSWPSIVHSAPPHLRAFSPDGRHPQGHQPSDASSVAQASIQGYLPHTEYIKYDGWGEATAKLAEATITMPQGTPPETLSPCRDRAGGVLQGYLAHKKTHPPCIEPAGDAAAPGQGACPEPQPRDSQLFATSSNLDKRN